MSSKQHSLSEQHVRERVCGLCVWVVLRCAQEHWLTWKGKFSALLGVHSLGFSLLTSLNSSSSRPTNSLPHTQLHNRSLRTMSHRFSPKHTHTHTLTHSHSHSHSHTHTHTHTHTLTHFYCKHTHTVLYRNCEAGSEYGECFSRSSFSPRHTD